MYVCFLALVIRQANRVYSVPHYFVTCGATTSVIFSFPPHYDRNGTSLGKVVEHKMSVLVSFIIIFLKNSHHKKNSARYYSKFYVGLHGKYRLRGVPPV